MEKRGLNRIIWALSFSFLTLTVICLFQKGLLSREDISIKSGEIDLSGTWKIEFDDRDAYARSDVDDSHWCLITVPEPVVPAQPGPGDRPRSGCPTVSYPKQAMRNHTYWYRRTFDVPAGARWDRPALFLGTVKQEAQVYWDGAFVGTARKEQTPSIFALSEVQASAGRHVLAVRVRSGNEESPGIMHSYPRRVALGSYAESVKSILANKQLGFESHLSVILQTLALLVLLYLAFRSRELGEDLFWLSLYFGGSALHVARTDLSGPAYSFLSNLSLVAMSLALAGYSARVFEAGSRWSGWVRRGVFAAGGLSVCLAALVAFIPSLTFSVLARYPTAFLTFSFACTLTLVAERAWRRYVVKQITHVVPLSVHQISLLIAVNGLNLLLFVKNVSYQGRAIQFHTPLVAALVTVAVIFLTIEAYVSQQKTLTFFGRFIRPGLKSLLLERELKIESADHWLRGRKMPILKIDIVRYSDTAYGMPYGMMRLFQHLWFSYIDRVVADSIFFDKAEGDGSIYFFRDDLPGGACSAALKVADEIEALVVPAFDAEFRERAMALLREVPEIRGPAERYLERYQARHGHSFWDRHTQVRFACVYGHADEGLWGMVSKSHYDVQGDLLILLARLEKQAGVSERVMSEAFAAEFLAEKTAMGVDTRLAADALVWRESEFKGIGRQKFAIARRGMFRSTGTEQKVFRLKKAG